MKNINGEQKVITQNRKHEEELKSQIEGQVSLISELQNHIQKQELRITELSEMIFAEKVKHENFKSEIEIQNQKWKNDLLKKNSKLE